MKRTLFVSRHRLTECPACHAHVRVGADVLTARCDFCAHPLNAPKRDVFTRLITELGSTTGGVVAASLLGLGLVNCTDTKTIDLGPGRPDTGDHMAVPLYGIPPVDSGISDATIVDAREPTPAPEYGGPPVPVDAGDPPPGPLYGIAPVDAGELSGADAIVMDAMEPPPEPDYGIAPIDPDASTAQKVDADDPPPVALYGIAPVPDDAGVREDAAEDIPVPLYGGAAVAQPSDEILS